MSRLIIGLAMVAAMVTTTGTAMAGKPAKQACMGETVSAGAHAIHPYGSAISGFARATDGGNRPGVGEEVQALQAGFIPDGIFPNLCN